MCGFCIFSCKLGKSQAKYGRIRALRQFMRLSRGPYFVFGAEKQLKWLVYFCEVFALQRKFALTRRRDLNHKSDYRWHRKDIGSTPPCFSTPLHQSRVFLIFMMCCLISTSKTWITKAGISMRTMEDRNHNLQQQKQPPFFRLNRIKSCKQDRPAGGNACGPFQHENGVQLN